MSWPMPTGWLWMPPSPNTYHFGKHTSRKGDGFLVQSLNIGFGSRSKTGKGICKMLTGGQIKAVSPMHLAGADVLSQ